MFSRSAWEPRWKYQAGRQHLCMNAAAEAALEGEWFDEKQPAPPPEPEAGGPFEIPPWRHGMPQPEMPSAPVRVKRKYVKKVEKEAIRLADIANRNERIRTGNAQPGECYDDDDRTPLH